MSYAENETELLRGMAEMFEEWKPFPKDKVERSIEKKEKNDPNRKAQTAVKNFRTKATDTHKQKQFMIGKDYEKLNTQYQNHKDAEDKSGDKFLKNYSKLKDKREKVGEKPKKKDKKEVKKLQKKTDKHLENLEKYEGRSKAMDSVARSYKRTTTGEDKKQAEANKKDKADRASAKSGLNRAGLEGALKAKPKREKMKGPAIKNTIKKESMNFTEFLDSTTQPLYEKEGEVPKCPPGYKYDVEMKMCVPKTNKDSIGKDQKHGNKDLKPGNGAGYNVWGNSGYSGAGFAWEEQPTSNDIAGSAE